MVTQALAQLTGAFPGLPVSDTSPNRFIAVSRRPPSSWHMGYGGTSAKALGRCACEQPWIASNSYHAEGNNNAILMHKVSKGSKGCAHPQEAEGVGRMRNHTEVILELFYRGKL